MSYLLGYPWRKTNLNKKSRENWLQLGDRNTMFFHSAVKIRQARNYIGQIYNAAGQKVSDYEELRNIAPAVGKREFTDGEVD